VSGPMWTCGEVVVGGATGGGGWVGVEEKVAEALVVLESMSGLRLYLVTGTLEGDFMLDGTECLDIVDPGWGIIESGLNTVEGAGIAIGAFVAIG
jgi:hypothetical protein